MLSPSSDLMTSSYPPSKDSNSGRPTVRRRPASLHPATSYGFYWFSFSALWEPRWLSRYSDWFTDWAIRASSHGRGKRIFCSAEREERPWGPPSLLFKAYRDSSPGVRRPGCEIAHIPSCSAEVRNGCSYTSTSPVCIYGVDKEKIIPHFHTQNRWILLCVIARKSIYFRKCRVVVPFPRTN